MRLQTYKSRPLIQGFDAPFKVQLWWRGLVLWHSHLLSPLACCALPPASKPQLPWEIGASIDGPRNFHDGREGRHRERGAKGQVTVFPRNPSKEGRELEWGKGEGANRSHHATLTDAKKLTRQQTQWRARGSWSAACFD